MLAYARHVVWGRYVRPPVPWIVAGLVSTMGMLALPGVAHTGEPSPGAGPTTAVNLVDDRVLPPDGEELAAPIPKPRMDPHTLYVAMDGVTLTQAYPSNSQNNTTSIAECAGEWPPYGDGPGRAATVQAVRKDWEDFNIVVTDQRPTSGDYTMSVIGPRNCIPGAGGIAPLHCGMSNPNAVNFTFAGEGGSSTIHAAIIAQEAGHTFGLEHTDRSDDVLSAVGYSQDPYFVDQCMGIIQDTGFCTSQHLQHCGAGQQNTYQEMLGVLGPSTPDTQAPVVSITFPADGQVFEEGEDFTITADASDDRGINEVQLFNNGSLQSTDTSEPYSWDVTNIPVGTYELAANAVDVVNNETMSATVTIEVREPGAPDPPDGSGDDSGGGGDGGGTGDDPSGTGDDGPGNDPGGGGVFDPDRGDRETGCGCSSGAAPGGIALSALCLVVFAGRRRRS